MDKLARVMLGVATVLMIFLVVSILLLVGEQAGSELTRQYIVTQKGKTYTGTVSRYSGVISVKGNNVETILDPAHGPISLRRSDLTHPEL